MTASGADGEFAACLQAVAEIDGWLRDEQARMLWDAARGLAPPATIVEIGSYHGRSTVVLATAAAPGVTVYAIDPHAGNDRGPGEWHGTEAAGQGDHERFLANLAAAGVEQRVTHVREFSRAAHGAVSGMVDLLYVDGAHGYRAATGDLVGWGERVAPGRAMIVHDVYNSVFVSVAVIRRMWFSRRWRQVGRHRSMVAFERVDLRGAAYVRSIAANVTDLPLFLRSMVVKTLRAAGVERLAVVVGHTPGERLY